MAEFKAFPKMPRLNRDMTICEKIDGTNGCLAILPVEELTNLYEATAVCGDSVIFVQSRKRFITPDKDNFAFARWVYDNAAEIVETLGQGRHFGEWWGAGVQRGYGLPKGDRRFSLFNVSKWEDVDLSAVPGLGTVPVLYRGPFDTGVVNFQVEKLKDRGSVAAPGFNRPEGVVVYHEAANSMFKVTCEKDHIPKGLTQ